VSFAEAASCFLDPAAFTAPDKDYTGRFILIGLSQQLRVLFVVSAEIRERIRIITARKGHEGPAQGLRAWPVRAKPIFPATI